MKFSAPIEEYILKTRHDEERQSENIHVYVIYSFST